MGEATMLQASRQVAKTTSAANLFDVMRAGAATLWVQVRQRRKLVRTRYILDQLSEAQLADAGIDRSTLRRPRPILEVEAGLMTKLMSMR
jgi:uncharacterized protein YjiS (DUF1127 family)